MNPLARDLVYAARTLRKNPLFALTAMATVALGIGASTAIFSVVNAVLLRPLPYTDEQRLALVWGDLRNRGVQDFPVSPGDLYDLKREASLFQELAAVTTFSQAISGDDGQPEQVQAGAVTTNFFRVLGGRIALGRDFTEQDGTPQPRPPQAAGARPGAPAVQPPRLPQIAVLSHAFWRRRYGADPGVLGRTINLGGGQAQVVGVLAPGFELLYPPSTHIERLPDVWTAMRIDLENGNRINHFLRVVGRLRPGVTVAQAQAQVAGITTELRQRFPIKETAGLYYRVESMHEDLVADSRPALLALMGAVIFVLLIACANVANLLLVRAWQRERELAVRAALGGGRWQLIRQMLAESLVLAGGGAVLGLGLARLGIQLLLVLKPEDLPRIDSVAIDPVVLGFTALSAVVAAAVFGVVPALQTSRTDVALTLRTSGRGTGPGGGGLRHAVVVAEVALSLVLLIGCGLMIRSFVALQRAQPGYQPQGVLTFLLPNVPARNHDERVAFARGLRERVLALPGVEAASASSSIPLDGQISNGRWGTEEALADPVKFQQATFRWVAPGYFETLRTPLVAGRTFAYEDDLPNLRLAIIDQRLAAKAFPNQQAVGQRLLARVGGDSAEWYSVVGVVGHQRDTSLSADGRETMFFPDGGASTRWVVRTAGDPERLERPVRAQIAEANPLLAVGEMQPMQVFVGRAQARTRFALVLIGVFASIAGLLAAIGLYGVLATFVRQRTAEIGVRMAFGAPRASILTLVVGQGLRLSGVGIGGGLLAAFALTRVMTRMLVGVQPTDPATFAAIAILFVLIAAAASWIPARRAAALDPAVALREE